MAGSIKVPDTFTSPPSRLVSPQNRKYPSWNWPVFVHKFRIVERGHPTVIADAEPCAMGCEELNHPCTPMIYGMIYGRSTSSIRDVDIRTMFQECSGSIDVSLSGGIVHRSIAIRIGSSNISTFADEKLHHGRAVRTCALCSSFSRGAVTKH